MKSGGQLLYRYRNGYETAAGVERSAAEAKAKLRVHGVSVMTNFMTDRACGVGFREVVWGTLDFRAITPGRISR